MSNNWTFRFVSAEDAEQFASWAISNPDIPMDDIKAGTRENNPTTQYFVVEEEGKVILCVPAYCVLRIAYLLFNPEADAKQRIAAMGKMREALRAFAANFGINSIETLTKSGYPVAQWAEKHGFVPEDRELFSLAVGLENTTRDVQ